MKIIKKVIHRKSGELALFQAIFRPKSEILSCSIYFNAWWRQPSLPNDVTRPRRVWPRFSDFDQTRRSIQTSLILPYPFKCSPNKLLWFFGVINYLKSQKSGKVKNGFSGPLTVCTLYNTCACTYVCVSFVFYEHLYVYMYMYIYM